MKNKILLAFIWVLLYTPICFSGQADSLLVDSLLRKSENNSFHLNNEKVMFFAKCLVGVPYKGGTLDSKENEELTVRLDSLDCTTYVETVLALYLSSKKDNPGYSDFKDALRLIRYRNGEINGYESRLHYFSDWTEDNINKGILCEATSLNRHDVRLLSLNYMTSHPEQYQHLGNDTGLVSKIKGIEEHWKNYAMPYIPKGYLKPACRDIVIKDGDILALTTSIAGLDVVHLGFAVSIEGRIHLLHASSLRGKIIIDDVPLYDYLKDKKKHTGIRILRVK